MSSYKYQKGTESYEHALQIAEAIGELVAELNKNGLPGIWNLEPTTLLYTQGGYGEIVVPVLTTWLLTSTQPTTPQEAHSILQEAGLLNVTLVNCTNGDGVICCYDGLAMHAFSGFWRFDQVVPAEGRHIEKVRPIGPEILTLPAGNYPYREAMGLVKQLAPF